MIKRASSCSLGFHCHWVGRWFWWGALAATGAAARLAAGQRELEPDCELDDDDDDDDEPPEPLAASTTLATAPLAIFWPSELLAWCWCCCWRLLLLYSERRLICLSILRTQVGKVFDQKDTYDWAVSGDLPGELAELADPDAAADEPLVAVEGPDEAAWATRAALLTMELAADRALARLGLEPPDEGASTAANGDEAAADTTTLARLELDEEPTGRVCT